jgi:hypothetical protein
MMKITRLLEFNVIMEGVIRNFDRAPEVKMLFLTLLLAINNGIHGLLEPKVIARIHPKQKHYFLGQPGYRNGRLQGLINFIKKVKTTENGIIMIPPYGMDHFSHFIHKVRGIELVTHKAKRKRTMTGSEDPEVPASPKTRKSPSSLKKVRKAVSKENMEGDEECVDVIILSEENGDDNDNAAHESTSGLVQMEWNICLAVEYMLKIRSRIFGSWISSDKVIHPILQVKGE